MAGAGRIETREVHRSWRADEQFSDVILVADQTTPATDASSLRTCLLVDGSSVGGSCGVTAGMVLALGQIRRSDRDAVIGFFPSLAHAAHLAQFDWARQRAYEVAAEHPRRLVVAGAVPEGHDGESEAVIVNAFGRFPHVSTAHVSPGRRAWRSVSMTAGTVDAFRIGLLAVDPALAALVDAIAASNSIRGEARLLREAAERSALVAKASGDAARARQACLLVPLMHGGRADARSDWRQTAAKPAR